MNEVYIMSATRSPVGAFGGSLKDFDPVDLGAIVAKESIKRSNISPEEIGHAVFGNVIHTEPRDMYVSRVIALNSGLSKDSCALIISLIVITGKSNP